MTAAAARHGRTRGRVESVMRRIETALLDGTKSLKQAFHDMVKSIVHDIDEIATYARVDNAQYRLLKARRLEEAGCAASTALSCRA